MIQCILDSYSKDMKLFRLLNSEIGNDLTLKIFLKNTCNCFRLLNSEIGNDPINSMKKYAETYRVFVSLTRR